MSELFVYVTTESKEEARKIGARLVEERLVACVNIVDGIESMFWWKDKIEIANEALFVAKTTEENMDVVIETIKKMHSYEVPCIVSLPITNGNPDFLKWISDTVAN